MTDLSHPNRTEQQARLEILLAQVEGATGPDSELDIRIAAAVNPGSRITPIFDGPFGFIGSNHEWIRLKPYSSSIDAALELVPTMASGDQERHWQLNSQRADFHGAVFGPAGWYHGIGKTPAIALVAAALRARLAFSMQSKVPSNAN